MIVLRIKEFSDYIVNLIYFDLRVHTEKYVIRIKKLEVTHAVFQHHKSFKDVETLHVIIIIAFCYFFLIKNANSLFTIITKNIYKKL